jgi:sarcosine oxidase subunit gamma
MSINLSSLTPATLIETAATKVATSGPAGRLSLRARGDLKAMNKALGLTLPQKVGARADAGNLQAVCLGPDEWTLVMPADEKEAIITALAKIYDALPHSVTDVSAREITFEITGPKATDLLSIGCPRDITTIAIGEARRTVFDGTTVVLWCDGKDQYRMDIWNSFAPFVADLLVTGAKEIAAEVA